MILINGDSFTAGEELEDPKKAWPYLLSEPVCNLAQSGYSNDAIVRTTVEYIQQVPASRVIIAWTSPHRIEIGQRHLTASSARKYGDICNTVFADWDAEWANRKFLAQVELLHGYLEHRKVKHVFVKTFEVPYIGYRTYWLGNETQGMVEWMGDCPKGPGGHPLELGHQRIAKIINEHIRNLGWLS